MFIIYPYTMFYVVTESAYVVQFNFCYVMVKGSNCKTLSCGISHMLFFLAS